MAQIIKRNGSTQEWDKSKLVGSLLATGLSADDSQAVATDIENWVTTESSNGPVPTSDVRVKVIEALKARNAQAAEAYSTWTKNTQGE